jgi:simple sugar transport system permease protein
VASRLSDAVKGGYRRLMASWLSLLLAAVAGLLVGAVMLVALGANPLTAYEALFRGAFGSSRAIIDTAVKAVPLALVGVGICIAFRANVLNIGGEGQLVMGGLASTAAALALPDLPAPVLLPVVMLAGLAGGAAWGAIPGALKAYLNVNEVLSTIMLNIVAVQLMNYLLAGPMVDDEFTGFSLIPQTERLAPNADLPVLVEGTQLHGGVVIAVLVAVLVYILLWRTGLGFRLRAVGLSRDAARSAGMPVKRTITLALTLSGAMAGLAGAVLVFGSASHRMVTDGTATGFTGSAGFNGIVTALFGGLNPLWTLLSAFVFGGLLVGGNVMQITVQVPTALIVALNGVLVIFVVSIEHVRRKYRTRLDATRRAEDTARTDAPVDEERQPVLAAPEGPQ